MTGSEIRQVLALLKGCYPNHQVTSETVKAYELMLSDLAFVDVKVATVTHAATSKWFPTIAEIRGAIACTKETSPGFDDAWREVTREIQRVGLRPPTLQERNIGEGGPEFSHPAIARVVQAIGWTNICMSERPGVERAAFRDMYKQAKERALLKANTHPLLEAHEERLQLKRFNEPKRLGECLKTED